MPNMTKSISKYNRNHKS
uniref:Uncharacterized protein n=1 Tax=Arundo donax TaxID=35708 RepID=A0A0A8ZIK0_ARUDO